MRLLLDTDAFCKLAIGQLLTDAVHALGTDLGECRRLPALPQMLRRGTLPRSYGSEACQRLLKIAESIAVIPNADAVWLDRLASVTDIDPGEALIFATAAQRGLLVLTSDKRALRALKGVNGFPDALEHHVVVLEAILMVLCDQIGSPAVRQRLGLLAKSDKTLHVCFSADNPDPRSSLESYFQSLAAEVDPLLLWEPPVGGAP
jgi:hypothetical protein